MSAAATHDMFFVAQRVSLRLAALRTAMHQLFEQLGATRLRSVDLYYRRQTDVALVALHLDPGNTTHVHLAAVEGCAIRADLAVLEPARLPETERLRFFKSYLPQYELKLERLSAPDDAVELLEEHLHGVAQRAASPGRPPESLEVRFRRGDTWQLGRVRSLSRDSLYVSTGGPPRRGDVIEVALSLGPAQLVVRAGVLQVTPADSPQALGAPGFGAQFLVGDISEADRVERFLAHVRKVMPAEISPPPRRRDVRYPVRWPIFVSANGVPTSTMATDVSRHGLFVISTVHAEAPPDTRFEISVPVDDGGAPLRVGARVARTVTSELARDRGVPTGFGVEITALSTREDARFQRFLSRIGRRAERTVLVGATPDRAGPIVAELSAAGYSAAQANDVPTLVTRTASGRPPDLVLVDATLVRADKRADDALKRALSVRHVPVVHIAEDTPEAARAAADLALLA